VLLSRFKFSRRFLYGTGYAVWAVLGIQVKAASSSPPLRIQIRIFYIRHQTREMELINIINRQLQFAADWCRGRCDESDRENIFDVLALTPRFISIAVARGVPRETVNRWFRTWFRWYRHAWWRIPAREKFDFIGSATNAGAEAKMWFELIGKWKSRLERQITRIFRLYMNHEHEMDFAYREWSALVFLASRARDVERLYFHGASGPMEKIPEAQRLRIQLAAQDFPILNLSFTTQTVRVAA
jgi:hypothetical protein